MSSPVKTYVIHPTTDSGKRLEPFAGANSLEEAIEVAECEGFPHYDILLCHDGKAIELVYEA